MIMQKCLMRLFISFLLLVSGVTQGEYLVFKKHGREITLPSQLEHKNRIYPLLMRYQFPMNQSLDTGDCERLFIENKLKERDPSYRVVFVPTTLYELFIIEKYTDRSNDLWAELFEREFLYGTYTEEEVENDLRWYFSNPIEASLSEDERQKVIADFKKIRDLPSDEKKLNTQNIINKYVHPFSPMGWFFEGRDGERSPRINLNRKIGKTVCYDEINENEYVINAHYVINTELGELILPFLRFESDDFHFPHVKARELAQSMLKRIIQNVRFTTPDIRGFLYDLLTEEEKEKYEPFSGSWYRFHGCESFQFSPSKYYHYFLREEILPLILSIVDCEYKSEAENKCNLYRGEPFYGGDFMKMVIDGMPRSLSFGASLFSGFMRDFGYKGACPFAYAWSTFYAVAINKSVQQRKSDLIVIPRHNTIVSFAFGKGEFFHPRTKFPVKMFQSSAASAGEFAGKFVLGMWLETNKFDSPESDSMIENVKEIYGLDKSAPEIYSQLLAYIEENISFIKTEQPTEELREMLHREKVYWHDQLPPDEKEEVEEIQEDISPFEMLHREKVYWQNQLPPDEKEEVEEVQKDISPSWVSRLLSYVSFKKS